MLGGWFNCGLYVACHTGNSLAEHFMQFKAHRTPYPCSAGLSE